MLKSILCWHYIEYQKVTSSHHLKCTADNMNGESVFQIFSDKRSNSLIAKKGKDCDCRDKKKTTNVR